jgi:AcrR family transcriptional regulator
MEKGASSRPSPRDRIVASARDLFHRHGIRGIGVDAIAEAAATNKMTLYRHFESKDALIVECLRRTSDEAAALWVKLEHDYPDPLARLRGWLEAASRYVASDRRGCDMLNAAVELCEADHPAYRVIMEFKTAQRDRLARLCDAARFAQPDLLADALCLLLEGARVCRQSVGAEGPSAKLVGLGEALIASFEFRPDGEESSLPSTGAAA